MTRSDFLNQLDNPLFTHGFCASSQMVCLADCSRVPAIELRESLSSRSLPCTCQAWRQSPGSCHKSFANRQHSPVYLPYNLARIFAFVVIVALDPVALAPFRLITQPSSLRPAVSEYLPGTVSPQWRRWCGSPRSRHSFRIPARYSFPSICRRVSCSESSKYGKPSHAFISPNSAPVTMRKIGSVSRGGHRLNGG
jgi:hypothetical protein